MSDERTNERDDWDPDPEWDDPGSNGEPVGWPSLSDLDPVSVVVGTIVGIAGLLLFLQPTVRVVELFGARIPTFVLSSGVLSLGFAVGAPAYLRRGYRLRGVAHAIGAVGFGGLFSPPASGVSSCCGPGWPSSSVASCFSPPSRGSWSEDEESQGAIPPPARVIAYSTNDESQCAPPYASVKARESPASR